MKKPGPPPGPSAPRPTPLQSASGKDQPAQGSSAPGKTPPVLGKSKAGKGPRPLSQGESMLWRHMASSLQPLKRAKGRVHASLENQDDSPAANAASNSTAKSAGAQSSANKSSATRPSAGKSDASSAGTPNLHGKSPTASAGAHRPASGAAHRPASAPPPAAPKPPPLSDFDAKRARKLRSGQVEIDARIDLHGLRQAEAHVALRGFLHASLRKGHRVVLVITGKGAPAGTRPEGHWTDTMGRSERGILRRSVPQWLSEPDLRAIVVSYTTAAIRHGGDGALYVHLRRLR